MRWHRFGLRSGTLPPSDLRWKYVCQNPWALHQNILSWSRISSQWSHNYTLISQIKLFPDYYHNISRVWIWWLILSKLILPATALSKSADWRTWKRCITIPFDKFCFSKSYWYLTIAEVIRIANPCIPFILFSYILSSSLSLPANCIWSNFFGNLKVAQCIGKG